MWAVCVITLKNRRTMKLRALWYGFQFHSLFLTWGLCRSSSCFSLSLSFSICCSRIWLFPPMTPLWEGGSGPPCFTGALWEILCWFRAVEDVKKLKYVSLINAKTNVLQTLLGTNKADFSVAPCFFQATNTYWSADDSSFQFGLQVKTLCNQSF